MLEPPPSPQGQPATGPTGRIPAELAAPERGQLPPSLRLRPPAFPLLLLLAALACNLPTAPARTPAPTPSPSASTTPARAAALLPASPTLPPPSPTPSETPLPPPEPLLHLVYVDSGDAWYSDGLGPARRLTTSGEVSQAWVTDDGSLVVLLLRSPQDDTAELHVIGTDGAGLTSLLGPADFDRLHPLKGALHITPSQLGLIPGSHTLLFNNRAVFEGPGLAKFDDLFALELDTGVLTPLLPPGSGGDFWFSPAGDRIALVRPDSMGLVRTDGGDPQLQAFRYPPVITYSEFAFYPIPVWSADSGQVQVAIPGQDPFAADLGGEVWQIPVSAGTPQLVAEPSGDLFRLQGSMPLLSPDLNWLAMRRPGATFDESRLVLVSLQDADEQLYDRGSIQWLGWAPDSLHFVYAKDGGASLLLGRLGAEPRPLPSGGELRWLDEDRFLQLRGVPGNWSIVLGTLEGEAHALGFPSGASVWFEAALPGG